VSGPVRKIKQVSWEKVRCVSLGKGSSTKQDTSGGAKPVLVNGSHGREDIERRKRAGTEDQNKQREYRRDR